jgi:hypothetical protein
MPQRPTIEPTDRSMPPVMMTKVMPMARKALSATCFDIRIMFAVEVKFGAKIAKKMITANSAMKVLSFISVRRMEPLDLGPESGRGVRRHDAIFPVDVRAPWPSDAAMMASSVASLLSKTATSLPLLRRRCGRKGP